MKTECEREGSGGCAHSLYIMTCTAFPSPSRRRPPTEAGESTLLQAVDRWQIEVAAPQISVSILTNMRKEGLHARVDGIRFSVGSAFLLTFFFPPRFGMPEGGGFAVLLALGR